MISFAPSEATSVSRVEGMKIRRVFSEMTIAFEHGASLLLVGETGVGKTFLSQMLHQQLPDASFFLPLSCDILSDNQLERQLFSRLRVPAERSLQTKQSQHPVTILLQEIETLSRGQQQQLLSLIAPENLSRSDPDFYSVPRCRIIVSCQHDLRSFVEQGRFRADLYYHLNAHCFEIPPLRDRLDEMTGLARQFVRQYSKQYSRRIDRIEDSLIQRLMEYSWSGNVRELKRVIERAVMYCDTGILNESHLPDFLKMKPSEPSYQPVREQVSKESFTESTVLIEGLSLEKQLANVERNLITQALIQNQQCRTDAARELGVSRVTLYNKMKKLGLETQKSAE